MAEHHNIQTHYKGITQSMNGKQTSPDEQLYVNSLYTSQRTDTHGKHSSLGTAENRVLGNRLVHKLLIESVFMFSSFQFPSEKF